MNVPNYRQQWAEGEIEAGTLLDAIDALAQRCRELEAENKRQAEQFREWQASHHENYCSVAAERDQLRVRCAELYEASNQRNAAHVATIQERDQLRAEVERLHQDESRLDWLASQARMIYGRRDEASYQLAELPELIQSARDECRPDDLRRALDDAMEASPCAHTTGSTPEA